jgi:hypothetical protein
VVVAATDLQLERRVAIKFLLPDYAKHQEAAQRFLREARAAVKIQSEHVARVIDVGTMEGGAPYMVMEYLEGRDLAAVIEEHKRLPVEEAVAYVLEGCDAIAEAHSVGIVHRDLKPANLFLTRQPDGSVRIKVLDFGISKAMVAGETDPSLTRTSSMMGSPLYMSPEQMKSAKNVDPRTDVWALGVILYELLMGTPPFDADSIPELSAKVLLEQPPPIRGARPDVPAALEAVVMHALEKDPGKRFATVADLAMALASFGPARTRANVERASRVLRVPLSASISNAGIPAPAAAAPALSQSAPTYARTEAGWTETDATRKAEKGRGPLVLGVAAAVVLAGVGAFVALRGGGSAAANGPSGAAVSAAAAMAPNPAARPAEKAPEAPVRTAEPQVAAAPAVSVAAASALPVPSATPEPAVSAAVGGQPAKPLAVRPPVGRAKPGSKPKPETPPAAPVDPTSGFGSRK